jgi:NAD(P)-dependent dehydrogenase (short-subunit alcohol dehydrogenase family)
MRFDGMAAIVTGGASGIGRETARALALRGARVAVVDRDLEGARRVATDIKQAGGDALAITIEVSDPHSVSGAFDAFDRWSERLDILVHSAGVGVERAFLDTTAEEWRRIVDIDLSGTFFCCQAAGRRMVQRRYGRIVTLASAAGVRGGTGRAAYGAAKGGVITLTRVMAVELAPYGITANTLAPGAIETELVARMHSAETREVYRRGIPSDRYGSPAEVAAAALFLASQEAAYVNGAILSVDGGFLAAGVMLRPIDMALAGEAGS